ncbi:hypothetical protein K435DRAFT_875376 [Dendrothele bispora CBS 962.96]|uniref:Uncharacterized protein n=1 Tax=Dendrothele bispora (strain CBS 962.96) TaxID=1314807 RepID=A0A4S8KUG4_DENBC|nr:hypothetical protein K435DRAFT_875376 [Dendrothele bispora CBS 962.96]
MPKSNHQKRESMYRVVRMTPGEKIEPPNDIVFIMMAMGAGIKVESNLLLELEADREQGETGEAGIRGDNSASSKFVVRLTTLLKDTDKEQSPYYSHLIKGEESLELEL